MTQSEAKMRILAEWRTWVGHRPATDSCHRNGAVAGFFDKCRAKVIGVEAEAFAAEGGFRCRLRRSRNLELKSRRAFALCGLRPGSKSIAYECTSPRSLQTCTSEPRARIKNGDDSGMHTKIGEMVGGVLAGFAKGIGSG